MARRTSIEPQEVAVRFWPKVDRRGPDECWPWLGGHFPSGYGKFLWNGKRMRANRVVWILIYGAIPADKEICHTCDNPGCVNVFAHLYAGTHLQNMQDRKERGRFSGAHMPTLRFTAEEVSAMRKAYARGESASEIARHFAMQPGHALEIITGQRYAHIPGAILTRGHQKGEANLKHKLTEQDVSMIRSQYAQGGVSQPQLARAFHVSQTVIHNIVTGKTWKHLER